MAAAAASIREPKSRLLPYFVLAFSFTWARWWLVVLEGRGIIELPCKRCLSAPSAREQACSV
jgi:hypothetical protein